MTSRWPWLVIATLCCLLATLVGPTPAQDSSRSACELPFFRGAAQPGGVTVKLTVVNIGRPCQIKMWIVWQQDSGTTVIRRGRRGRHRQPQDRGNPEAEDTIPHRGRSLRPSPSRPACCSSTFPTAMPSSLLRPARHLVHLLAHVGQEHWHAELFGERRLDLLVLVRD